MAPQQKSEQGTVHEITEENNIFRLRVADSLAYFVFYVAIPIFTAYASLARQSMSNIERIYSYHFFKEVQTVVGIIDHD